MNSLGAPFGICLVVLLFTLSCRPPGKPTAAENELKPEQVRDFAILYGQNCAGCHGQDGQGGSALALANPIYLDIATDDIIRRITARGIPGTLMPAFAKSSGGTLTDEQIDILVQGMRTSWARPLEKLGAIPPPYLRADPGDPIRGAAAYDVFCARCHGPEGKGSAKGSSIVDASFLNLVSEQSLRTTVIAGRPDLGQPDWRNDVPGRPTTPQEVSDVVAWLVAKRKPDAGPPYASGLSSQNN